MSQTSLHEVMQRGRRAALRTATSRRSVELVYRDEAGEFVIRRFPTLAEATEWSLANDVLPDEVNDVEETVSRTGRVLFTLREVHRFDA